MRCWQMMQQGLKRLFLVMLILVSCSAPTVTIGQAVAVVAAKHLFTAWM